MDKLRSIQSLRAIAVLAVVASHAFGSGRGSSGVDLFFVISGFIIARVSADRSPVDFAKARFWRIYPLYAIAVAPYVAWQAVAAGGLTSRIAATVTLWPIWAGEYQKPLLPVAWSLYFEILFYAGMTVWLLSRRVAMLAAVLLLLSAMLWPSAATAFLLSPIILEFAAGYGLARLKRFPLAAPALTIGLGLLFCTTQQFDAATMLEPGTAAVRAMVFGIPAVLAVYGALGLEQAFAGGWTGPLVRVGDASYSIYLTHLIPLHALSVWPAAILLPVAVLFGLVVHAFVERPLGAWVSAQRRAARRSPTADTANAALTSSA